MTQVSLTHRSVLIVRYSLLLNTSFIFLLLYQVFQDVTLIGVDFYLFLQQRLGKIVSLLQQNGLILITWQKSGRVVSHEIVSRMRTLSWDSVQSLMLPLRKRVKPRTHRQVFKPHHCQLRSGCIVDPSMAANPDKQLLALSLPSRLNLQLKLHLHAESTRTNSSWRSRCLASSTRSSSCTFMLSLLAQTAPGALAA